MSIVLLDDRMIAVLACLASHYDGGFWVIIDESGPVGPDGTDHLTHLTHLTSPDKNHLFIFK